MILKLKNDDYKLVARVLNGAFDNLVVNAIVEELIYGRIWVDNKAYPKTVFI
jgi:hypothetical protein